MNITDSIKIGAMEGLITLPYAYCETPAGTADKVIAPTNFVVETGTIVVVKFKNTNSAANPTLKYGESANPIHYHGSAITAKYLKAGYVYTFIYTGSAWDLIGEIDTDTHENFTSTTYQLFTSVSNSPNGVLLLKGSDNNNTSVTLAGYNGISVSSDNVGNITIAGSGDQYLKYDETTDSLIFKFPS